MAEQRFDFLKDVVSAIPDVQGDEDAETPRSTVSNTAFVFPTSTATSSSSTSSSAPQTPTSAPPSLQGQGCEPTTPSYASALPDQKPNFGVSGGVPGGLHHSLPLTIPVPTFPSRSLQTHSTMNPSVPVIVPNPSVIQQQQHLQQNSHILNPVGANSNPYIPSVSVTSQPGSVTSPSNPGGQYTMSYHQAQHSNPNGMGVPYGGGVNEQMLSYGVRGADGSLTSANPGMLTSMYDQKNSHASYQYHHQPQHQNQYHSQ